MVAKLQIEKTTVPAIFLIIQFLAIEIRSDSVFSHTKLLISWSQRMKKKMKNPFKSIKFAILSCSSFKFTHSTFWMTRGEKRKTGDATTCTID